MYRSTPDCPDSRKIKEVLAEHYDKICDCCGECLPPLFEHIQAHYKQQHAMDGFVKCCKRKLKTIDNVTEHVISHMYPDYYR